MLNHSTLLYSKGLPHKPGVRLLKVCEKGLDRVTTHGVTIYFLAGCRIWQEFSRQKKQEQTQKPVDPKRQQVRNRSRVFGRLFARLVTQFPASVSASSSSLSSGSLQSMPQPVPTSLKSFVFCFPLPEYEMPTRHLK